MMGRFRFFNAVTKIVGNTAGFALYMVMGFMVVAAMGTTTVVHLGGTQLRVSKHHLEMKQAFYLAEAAAEIAKAQLDAQYESVPPGENTIVAMGSGEYRFTTQVMANATQRRIIGFGAVPNFVNPGSTRAIETIVRKPSTLPNNFFDYVIYSAADVDANGNTFTVAGDVIYADTFESQHPENFNSPVITNDQTINPLAQLDFESLQAVAQTQMQNGHDNYYSATDLANGVPFPQSFYYQAPDPSDPSDLGIPNIVVIEGDLTLNGNFGTIGGFIIVIGNILTDPNATADTTINGRGTVDGVVYTTGTFNVNGGGGAGLNVNGGIIAGQDVTMNGNTHVAYNGPYMDSIKNFNPPPAMTVLSWREISS